MLQRSKNVSLVLGRFLLLALVTAVLLVVGLVLHTKRTERALPSKYLERTGYKNAFGYGLLPCSE